MTNHTRFTHETSSCVHMCSYVSVPRTRYHSPHTFHRILCYYGDNVRARLKVRVRIFRLIYFFLFFFSLLLSIALIIFSLVSVLMLFYIIIHGFTRHAGGYMRIVFCHAGVHVPQYGLRHLNWNAIHCH